MHIAYLLMFVPLYVSVKYIIYARLRCVNRRLKGGGRTQKNVRPPYSRALFGMLDSHAKQYVDCGVL